MIAIAVVASLVVYAWVMGYIGGNTSKAGNAIQVQSYSLDPAGSGNMTLYVQNVGQGSVTLNPSGSVYINSVMATFSGGKVTIPPGQTVTLVLNYNQWSPGQQVTIKVVAGGGTFSQITVAGSTAGNVVASVALNPTSGSTGSSVTVSGSGFAPSSAVTVKFDGTTVVTSPASVTTTTAGAISSGVTFTVPSGSSAGTHTVTITDASSNTGSTTFTVSGAGTVAITLTTSGVGTDTGTAAVLTVDSTPYTYSQLPLALQWVPGATHTISAASPVSGGSGKQYAYTSWSNSGSQTQTYTVPSSAATVTATYQTQYQATFAVTPSGSGTTTPPAATWFDAGVAGKSISATPSSGYTFSSWSATPSSSVTFANPNSAATTMTLSGAAAITATLSQSTVTITITSSPTGSGFVTVDGNAVTTPQIFYWAPGATHTIAASTTPVSGGTGIQYVYTSWSDSGAQSHTYTVPSSAATVAANFKTQYQVTFAVSPSGAGTTTPSAATWFDAGVAGQSISATATSGYTFSSWSASPSGSITFVSSTSASTTMTVTAASTVTANFNGATGTFGYKTQGSSSSNGDLEDYILGSIFSSPSSSVTAQSITAYIQVTGTHTIKAAIYTASGTFVAGTQVVSVTTSNDGWVTFNFASGVPLTANTNYLLVVWANSASGSANLYYTSSGGTGRYYSTNYATNWPSSPSFRSDTVGNYDYSIYCTYSIP